MAEFIESYDVTHAGRLLEDFFLGSRLLGGLAPYETELKRNEWLSDATFRSADINYLLGKAAEEILPRTVTNAIQNLSIGEFPHVIHLKCMPTGEVGHGIPESGFPFCAMSLRAISALLVKRDANWQSANFGKSFKFETNTGTELQMMHSDYVGAVEDAAAYESDGPNTHQTYSVLHYIKTNGKTPTWFTKYNLADSEMPPDESRHTPVIAKSGDVLIFNNLRVLHARGNAPAGDAELKRNFVTINIRDPMLL